MSSHSSKFNDLDPVYRELKVWQDTNLDGDSFTVLPSGAMVVDTNELKTLSELGITELDYINARFVRNGNLFALRSDALQADVDGTRVTKVGNGITIDKSTKYYEFNSTLRIFYAGEVLKMLIEPVANDFLWSKAVCKAFNDSSQQVS